MRILILVALLAACAPQRAVTTRGTSPAAGCEIDSSCWRGGSGDADAIVALSVAGALTGVVAVHAYRWLATASR